MSQVASKEGLDDLFNMITCNIILVSFHSYPQGIHYEEMANAILDKWPHLVTEKPGMSMAEAKVMIIIYTGYLAL